MQKFEPEIELCCLSGAEDVAGLSLLVSLAGPDTPRHVLVDCGRRPDDAASKGTDATEGTDTVSGGLVGRLLERLDGAGLDAIVITHAHTDRIGGLAAIHAQMPHVPIYTTAPSRAFVAQMWLGTSAPDPVAVEMMIGAMVPLSFGQRVLVAEGELALTCYPAGHVMGAASVLLESRSGHLLVTGDITITDQKTVPGMMLPVATLRPDIVVVESTYGGKLYASRAAEELLLVRQVAEILAQGGRVLFPCLALGRGQEVLAVVGQAMEQQALPTVPVWADGKLCDICDEYSRFPSWMTSWLRERMRRHDHPFFTGSVRAVPEGEGWPAVGVTDDAPEAAALTSIDGDEASRAAIVVTSRDVHGEHGLAPLIEAIADDPKSCLMLSHYDDEESLAEAWEEAAREGQWQGRALECQVASYKLSLHADTAQVVGAIDRMRPKQIVVVQGTDKAQEATLGAFERAGAAGVSRLRDAAPLRLTGVVRDVSLAAGLRGAGGAEQRGRLEFDDIPVLVEILKAIERPEKLFSVQEILLAWGDAEGADDPREQERVGRFLGARRSLLRRDHKRNHLFRLRDDAGPKASKQDKTTSPSGNPELPLDMFNALKAVDAVLTEQDGLYKRSAHQDEKRIQLSFYFPKIAAEAHADAIAQLAERTGWSVELRETPHQAALVEAATRLMPRSWVLKKQPSIHLHEDKVVVQPEEIPPLQKAQQIAQSFVEETGFRLEFKGLSLGTNPAAKSDSDTAGATPTNASRDDAPESHRQEAQDGVFVPNVPAGPVADEPWEINKAYQLIRGAFAGCPQPLQKVGLKGDTIEVSFISTQVGQRYEAALAELSQRSGWPIQIKDRADQHRIKAAAKELLAPWVVKKEPGFHPHSGEVHVTCGSLPTADELAQLNASFERDTGFQLKVKAML